MKKRIACFMLTLLMLVSLIPTAAITVNAASNLHISEEGIAFIKMVEGFNKNAYADGSQISIGYGTKANSLSDTISQVDADKALREELAVVDAAVNSFAATYGKNFTQAQHDALVSFSFNVGTGWMTSDGVFRQAVISGATGNTFLNAISLWSGSADPAMRKGLVNRRLNEADMYLNGNYPTSKTPRSNFRFVMFHDGLCAAACCDHLGDNKVQGFNANDVVPFAKIPVRDGYRFVGWYSTNPSVDANATWIPSLSGSVKNGTTLYAKWQATTGAKEVSGVDGTNIVGLPANYKLHVSYAASLNIYEKASATSTIVGTAKAGTTLTVKAEYMDNNGVKWVKIADDQWMKISDVKESTGTTGSTGSNTSTALVVTVTNEYINVRETPGTSATHKIIGKVNYNDKLTLLEVITHNNALWGRYEGGWIALMYTNYNEVINQVKDENGETKKEEVIATGTVSTNTNLRIREGASVSYTELGSLVNGTRVEIFEITTHKGHKWGRIDRGWICLDYVILDAAPVVPDQDKTDTTPAAPASVGTITLKSSTDVRKEPSTASEVVETLKAETSLTVTQLTSINNVVWAKSANGWFKVEADAVIKMYGVVTTVTGGSLNVRDNAGTGAGVVEKIPNGSNVTITGLKGVADAVWGKVGDGRWVSLSLVRLGAAGSNNGSSSESTENNTESAAPEGRSGIITGAQVVNVRVAPGVHNDLATTLAAGSSVKVYEQTMKDNATWCRIDEGWVAMMYVNLDVVTSGTTGSTGSVGGSGTDNILATGVVNSTMNLRVRDGAGVGFNEVASLPNGSQVVIFEKVTVQGVAWGRIDRGWICLTYVTITQANSDAIATKGITGTVVNCATGVNIRSAAGVGGALVGSEPLGARIAIYEQKLYNGSYWGRTDKGWVCMDYIRLDASGLPDGTGLSADQQAPTGGTNEPDGTTGTTTPALTTGKLINDASLRNEANASSTSIDNLKAGNSIVVTELKAVGTTVWGKVGNGWLDMSDVSVNATCVIMTKTGGTLNVRGEDCDTTKDPIGKIASGTQVTVTALKAVGGGVWGKIDEGRWVSMSLVKLNTTGTTGGTTTVPSTPSTGTTESYKNGIIVNVPAGMNANVRQSAGVGNPVVDTVSNGTKVKVYEQTTVDNAVWARIEQGWIYMYYVQLDGTVGGDTVTGGTTVTPGTGIVDTTYGQGLVNTDNLNVRSGAGFAYNTVATLAKGSIIPIYELSKADNMTWGRTDKGWVSMLHIATTYTGNTGNGKMGTAGGFFSTANIRSAPGTGNAIVGYMMVGGRIEIFEQQLYSGQYWGRMNQGWVLMQYITLEENSGTTGGTGTETVPGTGTDTGNSGNTGSTDTVTLSANVTINSADVTNAYGSATGAVVDTLVNGSKYTIYALQPQNGAVMARIGDGLWVNISGTTHDVAIVGTANPNGETMNIRKAPGVGAEDVGDLKKGDRVTITVIENVGGALWGKINTDQWVSLSLIKMSCTINPEYIPEPATIATVVSKATATGYSDNTMTTASGSVNVGDELKIYAYESGNLLQTDKGWVRLSDLGITGNINANGDHVNVRDGAGTGCNVVGTLNDGALVDILGYAFDGDNLWYKVGGGQYVSASKIVFS